MDFFLIFVSFQNQRLFAVGSEHGWVREGKRRGDSGEGEEGAGVSGRGPRVRARPRAGCGCLVRSATFAEDGRAELCLTSEGSRAQDVSFWGG